MNFNLQQWIGLKQTVLDLLHIIHMVGAGCNKLEDLLGGFGFS